MSGRYSWRYLEHPCVTPCTNMSLAADLHSWHLFPRPAASVQVTLPEELVPEDKKAAKNGSRRSGVPKTLPRAELLVHGGDLAYPNPTGACDQAAFGVVAPTVACLRECFIGAPPYAPHNPHKSDQEGDQPCKMVGSPPSVPADMTAPHPLLLACLLTSLTHEVLPFLSTPPLLGH